MLVKKKKSRLGQMSVGVEVKRFDKCDRGSRVPLQSSVPPMPPTEPPLKPRRCSVDGRPALFHRWVDDETALLRINIFLREEERDHLLRVFREKGVVPYGCSTDSLRATFALVEFPDGTVGKVKPEAVRFLDRGED